MCFAERKAEREEIRPIFLLCTALLTLKSKDLYSTMSICGIKLVLLMSKRSLHPRLDPCNIQILITRYLNIGECIQWVYLRELCA